MQDIEIKLIRTDGGTQPRERIDEATVATYGERMGEGETFPPVDVVYDGENFWLVDGFHRLGGAKANGLKAIAANVHEGSRSDAQWMSYAANKAHDATPLRRTNEDKKKAALAALGHPKASGMSDGVIAEHVGVSRSLILTSRDQVVFKTTCEKRTGRDGKQYPAKQPAGRKEKSQEIVNTETGEVLEDAAVVTTVELKPTKSKPGPQRGSYDDAATGMCGFETNTSRQGNRRSSTTNHATLGWATLGGRERDGHSERELEMKLLGKGINTSVGIFNPWINHTDWHPLYSG